MSVRNVNEFYDKESPMSLAGILRRLGTARSVNDVAQPTEAYEHPYTNVATEEDIFNCFKLLQIGRAHV